MKKGDLSDTGVFRKIEYHEFGSLINVNQNCTQANSGDKIYRKKYEGVILVKD